MCLGINEVLWIVLGQVSKHLGVQNRPLGQMATVKDDLFTQCALAAADPLLCTCPVSSPLYLAVPQRKGWGGKMTQQALHLVRLVSASVLPWTWGHFCWWCRKWGSPCLPHGEKSIAELAVSAQLCFSPLDTYTEGSGIWHKVPFQMGIRWFKIFVIIFV